jgi:hypothetical protein
MGLPKRLSEWIQIRIWKKHKKFEIWKLGKVTSNFVILATFPGTTPANSLRRLMEAIQNQNFSVLVLVNENDQKDPYLEILDHFDCTVLIRPNIGRDFGAYQLGFDRVYKEYSEVIFEKIVVLNDTLYTTTRTQEFYEYFLVQNEFNCLYLNKQGIAHASSHSIILRKSEIYSNTMREFWQGYYPSSERLHSIFSGEFGLTHTLGLDFFNPYICLETFEKMKYRLELTDLEILQIKIWSDSSDHLGKSLVKECLASYQYNLTLEYCLENFQISNSIGIALNRLLNIPIKMDLCKLGLITRESFLRLFDGEELNDVELSEINAILDVSRSGKISPIRFRIQSLSRALT